MEKKSNSWVKWVVNGYWLFQLLRRLLGFHKQPIEQFNELSKNKLAIFISHRMASTRFCDNIIVFKNGSIEEMGSHYELMKAHSVYWNLFNMQSKYYMNAESGKL